MVARDKPAAGEQKGRYTQLIASSVLFGIVLIVYVASYAPFVRFRGGDRPQVIWERVSVVEDRPYMVIADGRRYFIYRPVDWLIDRTILREPLLAWAELWGVSDMFVIAHANRVDPQCLWKDTEQR
jgi:hypothetical protein